MAKNAAPLRCHDPVMFRTKVGGLRPIKKFTRMLKACLNEQPTWCDHHITHDFLAKT